MTQSFDSQIHELAQNIVSSCTKKNLSISTVESCTGGMVAQAITSISGSSAIFQFGFITYSNKAKEELVNVIPLTIKTFGEVSENTCFEMAEGGLKKSHSDMCVSVSGIAGPGGATENKPVGMVCFALATEDDVITDTQYFTGSRDDVRKQATVHALSMIFSKCEKFIKSENYTIKNLSDCDYCPRLRKFILESRKEYPNFFNNPVPSFGDRNGKLLIVGLAPGLKGANRTGRPFTGDDAGTLLYATLKKFGYTTGEYDRNNNDNLRLKNCLITNAVKCVPPQNKPTTKETNTCLDHHFKEELTEYKNVKVFLALGSIAHKTLLNFFNIKPLSKYPFAHGAIHKLDNDMIIVDSYHCSRYNTNTKVLTIPMFENVFKTISDIL